LATGRRDAAVAAFSGIVFIAAARHHATSFITPEGRSMKGGGAQAASRAIPKDRTSADRILRSTPITPRSTFITPPFNSSLGRRGELLGLESTRARRRPLGTAASVALHGL